MTLTKKRVWILSIVLAGIVMAIGISLFIFYASHVETDDAQIENHIYPILARVSGYIQTVPVTDNQHVRKGETIATIDPRDLKARLDRAQASLTMANARLAVAKSSAAKSLSDLTRYTPLAKNREISAQQFDTARTAAQIAQADVAAADAAVAQAQAEVDAETLELSYTALTAPADGTVTKKAIEVGQLVSPGQALMAIVSDETPWVIANFKETQLRNMRAGQRVKIKIDAYPHAVFWGHVDSIQQGTGARFSLLPPENATGNYVKIVQRIPVKIVFDQLPDTAHPLSPGMSVVPEVEIK